MATASTPAEPLCVLSVHAHPDDEASKGASTMARYAAEGVRTVLVCCTGGEAGDILNPEADTPAARSDLAAVRRRELDESVRIIGYAACHMLGYRDSGMPGSEHNEHPECFANADLDEAVGRLVAIVRRERPQVIVTYDMDRGRRHPDHIRVHETSLLAFERAGDPDWYPEHAPLWQPRKLYYTGVFSRARLVAMHEWIVAQGQESPWAERLEQLATEEETPPTTRIHVGEHLEVGRAALRAHRTQVPADGFWFRVPVDVMRELHPFEEFTLARSLAGEPPEPGRLEDDLFAGVRPRLDVSR